MISPSPTDTLTVILTPYDNFTINQETCKARGSAANQIVWQNGMAFSPADYPRGSHRCHLVRMD